MINIKNMFGSLNYKVFTASGTWTPPDGVRVVHALVVGGGGGGRIQTGGTGGEAIITKVPILLPNSNAITITVGAGGTGNSTSPTDGNPSSFGSFIVARAGLKGVSVAPTPILPAPSPDEATGLIRVSGAGSSIDGSYASATKTSGVEFNGNAEDSSHLSYGLFRYYGNGLASGAGAVNSGQGGGQSANGGSGVVVVMWGENNEK